MAMTMTFELHGAEFEILGQDAWVTENEVTERITPDAFWQCLEKKLEIMSREPVKA